LWFDGQGRALVARKVFLLAVMGGAYPQGKECNLMGGMSNEHNHLVASAASSEAERFSETSDPDGGRSTEQSQSSGGQN